MGREGLSNKNSVNCRSSNMQDNTTPSELAWIFCYYNREMHMYNVHTLITSRQSYKRDPLGLEIRYCTLGFFQSAFALP